MSVIVEPRRRSAERVVGIHGIFAITGCDPGPDRYYCAGMILTYESRCVPSYSSVGRIYELPPGGRARERIGHRVTRSLTGVEFPTAVSRI